MSKAGLQANVSAQGLLTYSYIHIRNTRQDRKVRFKIFHGGDYVDDVLFG
jgi:hypothetical protein